MADNYLQFSEAIDDLTAGEETWLKEQLETIIVFGDKVYLESEPVKDRLAVEEPAFVGSRFLRDNPDFDSSFDVLGFDFAFEEQENVRSLWLYAESYGDPNHVAWLIQKFLKQFRPDRSWSLTYASTCSKPRVGEFGGGAVFVTAAEIKCHAADDFVQQQRSAFEQSRTPRAARPLRTTSAVSIVNW